MMRTFGLILLYLCLSLCPLLTYGKAKTVQPKLSFGSLTPVDLEGARLDGDILFDISWPGSEAKEDALKVHCG